MGNLPAILRNSTQIKDMITHFADRRVQHGISDTELPDAVWRVLLILENIVGLSSAPLPGSIDTGVCLFDMNVGLISIWPSSHLLLL